MWSLCLIFDLTSTTRSCPQLNFHFPFIPVHLFGFCGSAESFSHILLFFYWDFLLNIIFFLLFINFLPRILHWTIFLFLIPKCAVKHERKFLFYFWPTKILNETCWACRVGEENQFNGKKWAEHEVLLMMNGD